MNTNEKINQNIQNGSECISSKNILNLIERCHQSLNQYGEPYHLLLTGPTGAGKTTVIQQYLEKLENNEKVLVVDIPLPCSLRSLIETLLVLLGDPFPSKGTLEMKIRRLTHFFCYSKIELVILDDFHRLLSRNRHARFELSDFIVSLLKRTNVPFVFVGLEDTNHIIKENAMLARRVSFHVNLEPFNNEKVEVNV
ncbi:ATP-binding protein [Neobacillus drentensis]|uniref:ATP-binding protein n=1 Tax=Neobacillus drentensis TaxID=220684 RepID=UPI0030002398